MLSLFGNRKVVSKYIGNGKDAPVHAIKAYQESKGTALFMLNPALDGGEWPTSYLG